MSWTLRRTVVRIALGVTAVRAHAQRPSVVAGLNAIAPSPRSQPASVRPSGSRDTLAFTTDEGTWMSVDLSPDGKTLLFDLLGDLYTLPIAGGTATRITSGPAFDAQPRFSPDGKSIVFVSNRDGTDAIWMANVDGTNARAFVSGAHLSPSWSPDGKCVVASKRAVPAAGGRGGNNGPDVMLYCQPDGTAGRKLGSGVGPSFSPDGRSVYFISAPFGGAWSGREPLTIYNIATGQTTTRPGGPRPLLSPYGASLVFGASYDGRSGFKVQELATGADRWLTMDIAPLNDADATRDALPGYTFTSDSKALIAWSAGKLWRIDLASGQRTPVSFTAQVQQEVTAHAQNQQGVTDAASAPRDTASGTIVLRGARLITMKGREILEKGDLVVTNGRIAAVGSHLSAPTGAHIVDVAGKTIIPGYIDVWAIAPAPADTLTPPWESQARLAYGVTTAHLVNAPKNGAANAVDWTATIGAFRGGASLAMGNVPIAPLGNDLVQLAARSGVTYVPGLVKNDAGPAPMDYFVAHGHYHDDPKLARFVPHVVLDKETLKREKWTRDVRYRFAAYGADAARIAAAGGRVALGTRGAFPGIDAHWELWALNAGGMLAHDVLRAGTIAGAEALGVARDLGSLEPGKVADLQVLDGNPLADIHRTTALAYVMKNGRLYAATTLSEVWPRQRTAVTPSWVTRDPVLPMTRPRPVPPPPPHVAPGAFTVTALKQPRPVDPTYQLPLVPTRTARFTTTEGTWMSVDVSPDGKTVVFDLLGDLYTVPIAGGKATRIMGGMAVDVQPRYSPDGKQIVFVSDRTGQDNLWIADADGQHPRPVAPTALDTSGESSVSTYTHPVWAPDGQSIIDAGGTLYDVHTGAKRKVSELNGTVTVSGTNHYAYVASYRGVNIYDFTTGQAKPFFTPARPMMRPVVSPDNHWLVYATHVDEETSLRLHDLRTGEDRFLSRDVQPDASGRHGSMGAFPNFAFTPDNQAIVVTTGGKLWRIAVPSGARTPIPFQADVELDLGPLSQFQYPVTDTFTVRQIREPRLSPDGKRLAFIALDKLYLMDFPNGTPRRVTDATGVVENYPAWSPDGRYVAFSSSNDSVGGQIYRTDVARVFAANGNTDARSASELLTREPDLYGRLAYTPDGKRLVFGRSSWRELHHTQYDYSRDMPVDFFWMDAAGGTPQFIAHEIQANREAGVPPQFLATMPDRLLIPADGRMISMRWDGSDRRTLLRWPTSAGFETQGHIPTQGLLSPDGTRMLVVYRNNLYLTTVPAEHPDSLRLDPGAAASVSSFRRLSQSGAEFIGWSADGAHCYFALGHSLFLYDLTAGTAAPSRYDITVRAARAQAPGTIALRGARVITMKGDEVIARGDIVVRNGRITAVGPSGTVKIPSDARVIDVAGKTILPGYVDLHTHMLGRFITHNTQLPQFEAHLAYGVTTTRNPSGKTSDFLAYADRVDAGDMLGARALNTGPAVRKYEIPEPMGTLDEMRQIMRRYSEFYQNQTLKEYVTGNRRTRQLVVMAAQEQGISPTTEGAGDWKMSLTEMLDGYAGHEHTYEIYPLYRDVALLVAASGITYDPALMVDYAGGGLDDKKRWITEDIWFTDPKLRRFTTAEYMEYGVGQSGWKAERQYVYPVAAQSAAKVQAAGGHVGTGAHGELQGLGTHWEMWMLASGGMSKLDVLRAGTITGARAVGFDRDIGSLEVGKLADLQVLDGNPLERIRNTNTIRYVMKDGHLYDANTLDEVWPRQRKLARQWWQGEEPAGKDVSNH